MLDTLLPEILCWILGFRREYKLRINRMLWIPNKLQLLPVSKRLCARSHLQ
jgi:hypothetical protein